MTRPWAESSSTMLIHNLINKLKKELNGL
jgi:hypothetical protein